MQEKIRQILLETADSNYRDFSMKLLPGVDNLLGIRIPILRRMARKIVSGNDWRGYLKMTPKYFEECMLQGMVIGYVDVEQADRVALIESFVPKIDNWSVCDSFCCGLKFTIKHKLAMWSLLERYCLDQREYQARFGVVMLLSYYVDEEWIDRVLSVLGKVEADGYYVKMAVAWAIATCYIKFPGQTTALLKLPELDLFTKRKAVQKIIESLLRR